MESVNALVTITGIKYKEIALASFRHAKISFYVISQANVIVLTKKAIHVKS